MLELYKNIKSRRIELEMSQQELSSLVGYSGKSMISKIERGEVDLSQTMIQKFADALRTTPGELMGYEEEKSEVPEFDPDHREYDSEVNKSEDFYREFNISKKWFIKRNTMVSAFALLFIVITLALLLFL